MTALYRQDVFANNLANSATVGFKADFPSVLARQVARVEDGVRQLPSDSMLERLGGGAMLRPNRIDFSQGNLRDTGNDLDLAIIGDGFFVARDASDPSGDSLRLTRDGRMTRNGEGVLVLAGSGLPVLDQSNSPIVLPGGGKVGVSGDGTITQNGAVVGRLAVVDVEDRTELRKAGGALLAPSSEGLGRATLATGRVQQGMVEEAGVDPIRMLLAMTSAAREVDSNSSMIQQHDRLTERAISSLGRPPS